MTNPPGAKIRAQSPLLGKTQANNHSKKRNTIAERIEPGEFIYPWRFASTDHDSRPVSMNPNIMSGRLVVVGTRYPGQYIIGEQTGRRDD